MGNSRMTRVTVLAVALTLLAAFAPWADAATRGAFYYPWYPATWSVNGAHVGYHPLLGYYNSSSASVVDSHVRMLNYANVDVAIASWFGPGSQSESTRIPLLLSRTIPPLKWALFYECEGNSPSGPSCPSGGPDPSVSAIQNDLAYASKYTSSSAFMHVDGRPLIFVWSAGDSSCEVASRWKQAAPGWYVVLKLSSGFKDCPDQPDAWHQYAPSSATQHHAGHYYSISPGFKRADGAGATLARDVSRWQQQVQQMVASGEPWQLITTFNEWGEGTAVEPAEEWSSPSGYGQYLDALHGSSSGGGGTGGTGQKTPSGSCVSANGPPRICALSISPRRFRARGRVRYTLSAAARVRFTIRRGRFRARFSRNGRAGLNGFRLKSRVRGSALRPGRYRLVAVPVDSAGRRGASRDVRFRIVRRQRR